MAITIPCFLWQWSFCPFNSPILPNPSSLWWNVSAKCACKFHYCCYGEDPCTAKTSTKFLAPCHKFWSPLCNITHISHRQFKFWCDVSCKLNVHTMFVQNWCKGLSMGVMCALVSLVPRPWFIKFALIVIAWVWFLRARVAARCDCLSSWSDNTIGLLTSLWTTFHSSPELFLEGRRSLWRQLCGLPMPNWVCSTKVSPTRTRPSISLK
jgi:hypothetical protein